MKIEVLRLHRLEGNGPCKAFFDISLDNLFVIKGLKVIQGERELIIGLPREHGKDGKWYNTVIPLTREARNELEKVALEAYNQED